MVDILITLYAKIYKRYIALEFYCVKEAIAAKIVNFHFINGNINLADILSKHWGYRQIWDILQPLLFWQGDTGELLDKKPSTKRGVTKLE